jgi:uncharacterized protein with PIN domain
MAQAWFHFSAELNDFLPKAKRGQELAQPFSDRPSVKHLIEAMGIPHTEVARILVNGRAEDFDYLVKDADRIEVAPASAFNGMLGANLLNQPQGERRFVIDNHLGRLAAALRMLGFDALYRNDYDDKTLAAVAGNECRILLTRDRRLLMHRVVRWGYWVRSTAPREQLKEVVGRFNLAPEAIPFLRCIRCNGLLQPVDKQAILDQLEPLTRQYFNDFRRCPDCGQIYWKGSHWERMQAVIRDLLK